MEGTSVMEVSAGGTHTLLLSGEREVYVMGRGDLGRLGLGKYSEQQESIMIHTHHTHAAGTIQTYLTPQRLESTWFSQPGLQVRQISCGGAHSLALLQVSEELLAAGFAAGYVDESAEDVFR